MPHTKNGRKKLPLFLDGFLVILPYSVHLGAMETIPLTAKNVNFMTMRSLFYIYIGLAVLIAAGCQSGPQGQKGAFEGDTFLANRPQEHIAKESKPVGFWANVSKLLLPDTDVARNVPQALQAQSGTRNSAKKIHHPSNAEYQAGYGSSNSSLSLYDLASPPPFLHDAEYAQGQIFSYSSHPSHPSYPLYRPTDSPQKKSVLADTSTSVGQADRRAMESILEAKNGDSQAFQRLLKDIKSTPDRQWKINAEDLTDRLAAFRNAMEKENNPDIEAVYLSYLRKDILPNRLPSPKQPTKRNFSVPDRESGDDEYSLASDGNSHVIAEEEDVDRAPLPPPQRLLAKRIEGARTSSLPDNTSTLPATKPAKPQGKYGTIAQLDTQQDTQQQEESSPVVQVRYQTNVPNNNPLRGTQVDQAEAGDWKSQTQRGAEMLRREMDVSAASRTFANEGTLRLLELVLGNRTEAVRPFSTADKSFNEFWGNQMLGFSSLLDESGMPNAKDRHVAAVFRFDEGLKELRQLCPIQLKNVQLVRCWSGFGVFLPRTEDCSVGERIGLYMELENPTIRRSSYGYNVRMSVNYEIRDTAANVVCKKENISAEQTTPTHLRDNCIHLDVDLPATLPLGHYQLRVSVTDMNSEKLLYAEEQIPIRVIGKSR